MQTRLCLLIALLMSLTGCIITPRIEYTQTLTFDIPPPPSPKVINYNDLLCCTDCRA